MEKVAMCPVCGGTSFGAALELKDESVSKEKFGISHCSRCGLGVTSPRPKTENLTKYYQSDTYVSHAKKANTLINKVYLFTRHFTLSWKLNLIKSNSTTTKSILDFGCGTGDFLKLCIDNGLEGHGFEPTEDAKFKAESLTGALIDSNLENLKSPVDVITMWHVLEHVPDPSYTIKTLSNLLTENGTMFIAVPNYKSFDAEFYREKWAAYDVPRHLWHFSKKNMEMLLINNSLKLQKIIPMKLDAYYVSMLSEKYKTQNPSITNLLKGLMLGAKSNNKARKSREYSSLIYIAKK